MNVTTGNAPFRGYATWYRITGDLAAARRDGVVPLVVLHGGPGAPHPYLLSLTGLAAQGRPVIHYDQLGCGNSTRLPDADPASWTVDFFLDELANLLRYLGIEDRYDLLGQSWGGMLAAEHAVRRPRGLRRLVLANSPASMAGWSEAADSLRADLPDDVREALERHEATGAYEHPEYLAATNEFYARHVCRLVPVPPEVAMTFMALGEDPTVYNAMNGPNEFHVIGSLAKWSVIDRLHQVEAPTLVINGRHDEATAECVAPYVERIPDARKHVFEDSSHMPHVEEREEYLRVVGEFLA
jgi:L-proline amide hydrolase